MAPNTPAEPKPLDEDELLAAEADKRLDDPNDPEIPADEALKEIGL